jgi:transcriptional regulator GlxA family with amidase domain
MRRPIKTIFVILPKVHLIDLAGPVQVFYEANQFGASFEIGYCGISGTTVSQQGLAFMQIPSFQNQLLSLGDYLFICGIDFQSISDGQLKEGYGEFFTWLQEQHRKGVNVCSVCSGTYVLAASRLLELKTCTTHWKCIGHLKKAYPGIRVVNDQLFVKDGNMYTSAGMTSGIDMALYIVEEHFGPVITSKVAREMVVFLRRSGSETQNSIYLDYRTHIHPAVHQVQDHLIQHASHKNPIEDLAAMVNMSERNLTRLFRKHTGISIIEFKTRCRLAYAETLLSHPGYTIDNIAHQCGFANGRQLRRIWQQHYKETPSAFKIKSS